MKTLAKLQFRWFIHTQNITQLATYLQSPSYKIRRLTAYELGKLEDVKTIPFLLEVMDDAVLEVAETALYAIEKTIQGKSYLVEIQSYRQKLEERKQRLKRNYKKMKSFKFEKASWLPYLKEKLKQPIHGFG